MTDWLVVRRGVSALQSPAVHSSPYEHAAPSVLSPRLLRLLLLTRPPTTVPVRRLA